MITILLSCTLTIWLFGGHIDSANQSQNGPEI
jgi:hypothetical protein